MSEAAESLPGREELLGRLLELARRGLLLACLLGCTLALDAASADPLAPKALGWALAAGWLPALSGLRLWWGQHLRLPSRGVLLALLALALSLSLSWALSPLGLVSRAPWQQSLLALLLLLGAVDLASAEGGRESLLRSLSLAALLAGALSLAQRLGWSGGPWAASAQIYGGRLPSSFGNPNFAGGFFALLLPLLTQQALAAAGRFWRWLAALAAGLSLLGLAFSGSKAAWLGLAVSAALAGHLLFRSDADPAARRKALLRLGLGLGLGLLLSLALAPQESRQRLLSGPRAWAESVQFRRYTRQGSLRLIQARPLLGWGPGSFAAAYPPYRPPQAMADQSQHAYEVTAPENWVLQLLAEGGVLSLAAAAWLLSLLALPLWRRARAWASDPGASLSLALLSSLAAGLACNLASLDGFLPSSSLPFLLLLALAPSLAQKRAPALSLNGEGFTRVMVSLGLAALAFQPALPAFTHFLAARELAAARQLSLSARHAEAEPRYAMALDLDPALLDARYLRGLNGLDRGGKAGLEAAERDFAELRRWAPDFLQLHAQLGRLRVAQARFEESERKPGQERLQLLNPRTPPQLYEEAAAEYAAQLKLDPWDKDSLRELAGLLAERGRLEEALSLLEASALRWPQDAAISGNIARLRQGLAGKAKAGGR